jgi:hypothetical protein
MFLKIRKLVSLKDSHPCFKKIIYWYKKILLYWTEYIHLINLNYNHAYACNTIFIIYNKQLFISISFSFLRACKRSDTCCRAIVDSTADEEVCFILLRTLWHRQSKRHWIVYGLSVQTVVMVYKNPKSECHEHSTSREHFQTVFGATWLTILTFIQHETSATIFNIIKRHCLLSPVGFFLYIVKQTNPPVLPALYWFWKNWGQGNFDPRVYGN